MPLSIVLQVMGSPAFSGQKGTASSVSFQQQVSI